MVHGIFVSREKERSADTRYDADTRKHHAEREGPGTEDHTLDNSVSRKCPEQTKLETESRSPELARTGGGGVMARGCRVSFWGDENWL